MLTYQILDIVVLIQNKVLTLQTFLTPMAVIGDLHTIADNHSVKEAVIAFTLSPRITNINTYRSLLDEGKPLNGIFQKFEPVNYQGLQVETKLDQTNIKATKDKGFKMIEFVDGSTANIIQLLPQSRKSLLTYNTIRYSNWTSFITTALERVRILSTVDESLMLESIGVMFIDEFFVDSNDKYIPSELFNSKSENLPKNIFLSDLVDYSLNTHHSLSNKNYIENISIRVFNQDSRKIIRITGNTMMFVNPMLFTQALSSHDLRSYFDFGHDENKDILRDILSPEIIKLIGL